MLVYALSQRFDEEGMLFVYSYDSALFGDWIYGYSYFSRSPSTFFHFLPLCLAVYLPTHIF
jgi:hypothetical protein